MERADILQSFLDIRELTDFLEMQANRGVESLRDDFDTYQLLFEILMNNENPGVGITNIHQIHDIILDLLKEDRYSECIPLLEILDKDVQLGPINYLWYFILGENPPLVPITNELLEDLYKEYKLMTRRT